MYMLNRVVPSGVIVGCGAVPNFACFWYLRTPLQKQRMNKVVGAPSACLHKKSKQDHPE